MSVNEKMTAIADEIRNKTLLTDKLTLDQMVIDISSLQAPLGNVLDYVRDEAERVASVVKNLQTENTISFITMSDTHSDITCTTHASQASKIITRLVPIDFTAVLGDWVSGAGGESLDTHLENLLDIQRPISIMSPDLRLEGNHDANIYSESARLSASDIHKYIGRFNNSAVKPDTEVERGYFHIDIKKKETRVICLNSSDLKDISTTNSSGNAGNQDGHHISADQFRWFIDILSTTISDGLKRIILLSHHPIHWYGSMVNVLTLLDAYTEGISGSISVDNETINYDFSNTNGAKIVGTFHGHTHNLIYGKAGRSEFLRFGNGNVCSGRTNEYGSTAYGEDFRNKYGETDETATEKIKKVAGTARETVFCVYTIDFENEVVYATAYGAGYDRLLSFKGIDYYIVSNILSGVSNDNSISAIEAGQSYTANLTVADTYTLKEVTVTMGGVDITNEVYSNGVISIPEVTGDIIITATAKAPVVNLVTTALALDSDEVYNNGLGYKNGYYVSTSGGGDSVDSNCVTTGLIEYPISDNMIPNTLYVKGITLDTTSHTRCAIYTEDKTYKTCMGNGGIFNPSYFTVTELGEKYYKLEPVMHDEDTTYIYHAVMGSGTDGYTSVKYIRCSFDNNVGENLFISTEPIE